LVEVLCGEEVGSGSCIGGWGTGDGEEREDEDAAEASDTAEMGEDSMEVGGGGLEGGSGGLGGAGLFRLSALGAEEGVLGHVGGIHVEEAGIAQGAVEGGACGMVEEKGEGGNRGMDGADDEDDFGDDVVEDVGVVVVVVPEVESPKDGDREAEDGEGEPAAEHQPTEGEGTAGVEGRELCGGLAEESGEAARLVVEEWLEVGEEGVFFECVNVGMWEFVSRGMGGCGSGGVTTLLPTLRFA
jgi:hypothetical protein